MPVPLDPERMKDLMAKSIRESESWKILHPEPKPWWEDVLGHGLRHLLIVAAGGGIGWGGFKIFRSRRKEEPEGLPFHVIGPDGNPRRGKQGVYGIGPDGKVWMRGNGFIFRPSESSGVEQASMSPGQPKPEADDKPDAAGGFDWSSLNR
jgi:hypothetical protein